MSNAFTRVPERPVPPLPGWTRVPLRVADLLMVALWSRPPTGTLATTWVTPATLQLCAAVTLVGGLLGLGLLFSALAAGGVGLAVGGAALLALALAAACVVIVGIAQRRA